jgi:hypothetical protein
VWTRGPALHSRPMSAMKQAPPCRSRRSMALTGASRKHHPVQVGPPSATYWISAPESVKPPRAFARIHPRYRTPYAPSSSPPGEGAGRGPEKAAAKAAELGTQLYTVKADAKAKLDAAATAQDAAKAAEARWADTAKAAREAKLALELVSVFISRATQRLYVRRGFGAFLEVPVTIRNPDKQIGTHVFTVVARTEAGLRWTAVTIDSGDDAKSALDRITIPPDVLDRIAPAALPRSSITILDEPLNRETNYRREFVVVLNNQPQGGLAMRRQAEVSVARRESQGASPRNTTI